MYRTRRMRGRVSARTDLGDGAEQWWDVYGQLNGEVVVG
jgi:hypothetical protein